MLESIVTHRFSPLEALQEDSNNGYWHGITTYILRPPLHEHGFICNRIVLYTVTPSVYTETMCNRVLLKTLTKVERFQNDTVTGAV